MSDSVWLAEMYQPAEVSCLASQDIYMKAIGNKARHIQMDALFTEMVIFMRVRSYWA